MNVRSPSVITSIVRMLLLLTTLSASAIAQEEPPPPPDFSVLGDNKIDLINDGVGWQDWENFDPLTGTVVPVLVDLVLPGKIPIELSRYAGQRPMGIYTRPIIMVNKGDKQLCGEDVGDVFRFYNGSTTVSFYSTDIADSNKISHFPNNAIAVSPKNWFLSCASNSVITVHSPTGLTFEMTERRETIDFANGLPSTPHYYLEASRINDQWGNWVEFDYRQYDYGAYRSSDLYRLAKIEANDGRIVTFSELWGVSLTNNHFPRQDRTTITASQAGGDYTMTLLVDHQNGISEVTHPDESFSYLQSQLGYIRVTQRSGGEIEYFLEPDEVEYFKNFTHSIENRAFISSGYHVRERKYKPVHGDHETVTISMEDNDNNSFKRIIEGSGFKSVYIMYRFVPEFFPLLTGEETFGILENASGKIGRFEKYIYGNGNSDSIADRSVTFEWRREREIAYATGNRYYPAAANHRPSGYFVRIDEGVNPEIYRMDVLERDEYDRPTKIEYASIMGYSRTQIVQRSYKDISDHNWIFGLLEWESVSDVDGNIHDRHDFIYSNLGELNERSENGRLTAKYTYNSDGYVETSENAEGHKYTYSDYSAGVPRTITNPFSKRKTRDTTFGGMIKEETKWGSSTLKYVYEPDSMYRVKSIASPRDETEETLVSWLSPRHRVQSIGHRKVHLVEDGFGNTVFEGTEDTNSQEWSSIVTRYDSSGRVVFKSVPSNTPWDNGNALSTSLNGVQHIYDAEGRLVSTSFPSGVGNTTYSYNKCYTTPCIVTTIGGKTTEVRYESFGNVNYQFARRIIDASGINTLIETDLVGRVGSVQRDGLQRSFVYNNHKQLESATHPESGVSSYQYYGDGMIKNKTNNGNVTSYIYDENNRIRNIRHQRGSLWVQKTYDYDDFGNMLEATSSSDYGHGNAVLSYEWNDEDKLKEEKISVDDEILLYTYHYNELGHVSSAEYPGGNQYEYAPNARGLPTQIVGQGGKTILSSVEYFPNGAVKKAVNSGGVYELEQYPHLRAKKVETSIKDYKLGATYAYDSSGNLRVFDISPGKRLRIDYDALNQVKRTTILSGGGPATYTPPSFSDVTSKISWEYIYDDRGNIETATNNGTVHNYTYDTNTNVLKNYNHSEDRFVLTDGWGNVLYNGDVYLHYDVANQIYRDGAFNKYGYDAYGHRVFEKLGGLTDLLLYSSNGVLLYRYNKEYKNGSEYHYLGDKLFARRDTENVFLITEPGAPASGGGSSSGGGQSGGAECVDHDGDGWGWDGTQSCQIGADSSSGENNGGDSGSGSTTGAECVDDDGDGWGWDGTQSCQVGADSSSGGSNGGDSGSGTTGAECVDDDGDGWGWDGTQSCQVGSGTSSGNNGSGSSTGQCVDHDGDGWGWNGTSSCQI